MVAFSPPDMPMTPSRGRNAESTSATVMLSILGIGVDVGQDQIESPLMVLNQPEAGFAVGCLQHDIAFVGEHATHNRAVRVVLDHEDGKADGRGIG